MSKIKTAWAVVAVLAVIGVGTMALVASPATTQTPPGTIQQDDDVEDCDAEDWINREDDCGFTKPKTTAPKATAKPRATRR